MLRTTKRRKANCIGHVLRRNCPQKHVIQGQVEGRRLRDDEEEDVSSYRVTLRKGKDTVSRKRKH
jgi:hypothetical protein